ncbi:amino acid ABC transporter permease [Lottiidibacillus patelloidae]|uniref:Amino acid ABC transporter permease n=1 Tax=Lottiidibacillus patelloidae TaxID=2670334 RepID=A0A263BSP2_9BACI|nr:ABC transporter permease subunit [Lottiidibacillus patelloidae]OZM56709.1 amino acid ABC transporter permease [Lottiidibacillus patelloidae]
MSLKKQEAATVAIPFWRDKRYIPIIAQALFVVFVASLLIFFAINYFNGMAQIGRAFGYQFLDSRAGFAITDTIIKYVPSDSYGRALFVGIVNTIKVSFFGLILATILGFIVGIARLSPNWLTNKVSSIYIETFRNTPLLVQLFIWYFAVILPLPLIKDSVNIGIMYLSNRGAAIPWYVSNEGTLIWVSLFIIGIISAFFLWKVRVKQQVETGKNKRPLLWAFGALVTSLLVALIITGQGPVHISLPSIVDNSYVGGVELSPGFLAVLIGLVMYTATYIAEIVRAGIMAVSKGQIEAAKALGLKNTTTLRLVTLPQAIRIIIPPLTSQYLNLIKNSSLAAAVAFPEIVNIGYITLNQTGRDVEVIFVMISVYLFFSLSTSILMNIFNKYTQLVER